MKNLIAHSFLITALFSSHIQSAVSIKITNAYTKTIYLTVTTTDPDFTTEKSIIPSKQSKNLADFNEIKALSIKASSIAKEHSLTYEVQTIRNSINKGLIGPNGVIEITIPEKQPPFGWARCDIRLLERPQARPEQSERPGTLQNQVSILQSLKILINRKQYDKAQSFLKEYNNVLSNIFNGPSLKAIVTATYAGGDANLYQRAIKIIDAKIAELQK
jgi:hypothetical protein